MVNISVVIPVYNSENSIERVVTNLIDNLSLKYNLEIVLVNDGSKDKSDEVCISLFNKNREIVKFYSLAKNVGEHNAVMAGLNMCNGDYVVIMDDDFQNPISEVIKLFEYAIKTDYDVVYTYYAKKQHSFFRNLGSKFNDKVANVMLNKPKDLYLSSFKLINRFLVNEIVNYNLPYPYVDGLILRSTDKIGKIEVDHQKREVGKSGYTIKKLVSLWMNMFTNFSIIPLRFSTVLGFFTAAVGVIIGAYAVVEKINNPDIPVGYTSLFVIICLFFGIVLLALGMIGEYLGRIFISLNKKPQYLIRKYYEEKK